MIATSAAPDDPGNLSAEIAKVKELITASEGTMFEHSLRKTLARLELTQANAKPARKSLSQEFLEEIWRGLKERLKRE